MKFTSFEEAKKQCAKEIKRKFEIVKSANEVSGIHLGRVELIDSEGYGESVRDMPMYTPSQYINVNIIAQRSSQGRFKVFKFEINSKDIQLPYGGEYISNIISKILNY